MKFAAYIFFIVFTSLNLELAFNSDQTVVKNTKSCMKKCTKNAPQSKKDDCNNNRCNPFMACLYGNYFLNSKYNYTLSLPLINKEKKAVFNDSRLSTTMSECWHPPEYFHSIA